MKRRGECENMDEFLAQMHSERAIAVYRMTNAMHTHNTEVALPFTPTSLPLNITQLRSFPLGAAPAVDHALLFHLQLPLKSEAPEPSPTRDILADTQPEYTGTLTAAKGITVRTIPPRLSFGEKRHIRKQLLCFLQEARAREESLLEQRKAAVNTEERNALDTQYDQHLHADYAQLCEYVERYRPSPGAKAWCTSSDYRETLGGFHQRLQQLLNESAVNSM